MEQVLEGLLMGAAVVVVVLEEEVHCHVVKGQAVDTKAKMIHQQ